MLNYDELIKTTDWNLIKNSYDVTDIVDALSLKQSTVIASRMLYNKEGEETIQNYAVELLYAIRKKYSTEWDLCWKLDILLGMGCDIIMRYDERYLAYKSASEKISPVPSSLKVLLAECYFSPGTPPVTQKEAKELLLEALEREQTIEAVSSIIWICERQKKLDEVRYWNQILKKVEQKNLHIHSLLPSFLEDHV